MARLKIGTVLTAKNTIRMDNCNTPVFTTGKHYKIRLDSGHYYTVTDDDNEDHQIGSEFIGENFLILP